MKKTVNVSGRKYFQPFDPGDPFDAMAESFRRHTADMALTALDAAVFRDLDGARQIECFIAGVLTGLVGVCFAQIETSDRNKLMRVIEAYLPQARKNAEEMLVAP
ncbi:MAG: hypothetical protein Q7R45_08245 [Sulfuricaulis sp.]|nr:hypothetical protein [Sulfuricaulis sp.]